MVIRQKGANIKTGVSRQQNTPSFPKNEHFLPPDTHTHVCISDSKKYLLFGKFGGFVFLNYPFWNLPFCLITDEMTKLFEVHGFSYLQIFCSLEPRESQEILVLFPVKGTLFLSQIISWNSKLVQSTWQSSICY